MSQSCNVVYRVGVLVENGTIIFLLNQMKRVQFFGPSCILIYKLVFQTEKKIAPSSTDHLTEEWQSRQVEKRSHNADVSFLCLFYFYDAL